GKWTRPRVVRIPWVRAVGAAPCRFPSENAIRLHVLPIFRRHFAWQAAPGIIVRDRDPAPTASGVMGMEVVKIVIVDFAHPTAAKYAAFGAVILHFGLVAMVVTKEVTAAVCRIDITCQFVPR